MSETPLMPFNTAPAGAIPGEHAAVTIKPSYDDRLCNEDLAPLRRQTWTSYNKVICRAPFGIQGANIPATSAA